MIKVEYTDEVPLTVNEMAEALDIKLIKVNALYHWKLSYPGKKRRDGRCCTSGKWLTRDELIEEFPFVAPLIEGVVFGFVIQLHREGEWLRISQAQSRRDLTHNEFIHIREVGRGDSDD